MLYPLIFFEKFNAQIKSQRDLNKCTFFAILAVCARAGPVFWIGLEEELLQKKLQRQPYKYHLTMDFTTKIPPTEEEGHEGEGRRDDVCGHG
jgi:hypothetical protein